jgi:predicted RNA-binding protein with TRAM domain
VRPALIGGLILAAAACTSGATASLPPSVPAAPTATAPVSIDTWQGRLRIEGGKAIRFSVEISMVGSSGSGAAELGKFTAFEVPYIDAASSVLVDFRGGDQVGVRMVVQDRDPMLGCDLRLSGTGRVEEGGARIEANLDAFVDGCSNGEGSAGLVLERD